jgi:hypothetical protein
MHGTTRREPLMGDTIYPVICVTLKRIPVYKPAGCQLGWQIEFATKVEGPFLKAAAYHLIA